ncbi:hypothetical protein ACHAWC_009810 [Mediolabrus comicus]
MNPTHRGSDTSPSPTSASEEGTTTTTTSPSKATFFTVRTKFEPSPQQRQLGYDAFSYYSNKFNRMKTLLLKDDDVEVLHSAGITFQGSAATVKRRKVQDSGVRQTRLSFEVHPSLLLDEDFLGSLVGGTSCVDISDDESDTGGSDDDGSTSDVGDSDEFGKITALFSRGES